jgi:plastocyanin
MKHSVIIPEFISHEKIRSFIPEVVKIQNGDNVKWIKVGKDFHNLYFFGLVEDLSKVEILKQLQIDPEVPHEAKTGSGYSLNR